MPYLFSVCIFEDAFLLSSTLVFQQQYRIGRYILKCQSVTLRIHPTYHLPSLVEVIQLIQVSLFYKVKVR